MSARTVSRTETGFTIQVQVPYSGSMLEAEDVIQRALNQAGVVATAEAFGRFDTDGKSITVDGRKLTRKGRLPKDYQTPYGVATVRRHVYQPSRGGKTFCLLDRDARIVVSSTPRFAKKLAHKYAEFGSARVIADLAENHGRQVARSFVRNVADAVAAVALAREADWEYQLPAFDEPVATVTVGLGGTCMLMGKETRREAMVGTLGFYNKQGERLHTVYTAATPEYGKLTFQQRFDREIDRAKAACPRARYVGLADGAKENWTYLELVTDVKVVDFYHVTQYVWAAAEASFASDGSGLRPWVDAWCHRLKHEPGAAGALIEELQTRGAALGKRRLPEAVEKAQTYLRNQVKGGRLNYAELVEQELPIGSGVTEAACKVLVKQRRCGSGMRWKEAGAAAVLSVRCLTYTAGRGSQFWQRIDGDGLPVAA
ncbi:ISKra4 family transposase [Tautonia plasticadhaerens]|uniref:ISKra4 family transposase n=1 Tax=Tautonia plasticadhaerens TaxID=2527974 RepID=A0A518H5Z8_9BACT|nr:ISKra4 family transposase [Tautonia plasticadhaerens]QDV36276.1 hypothetical protein ElP_41950 [Tautonia plasticadhaerens]